MFFVAAFSQKILRSVSQTQLTWATSSRSTSASFKCKNPNASDVLERKCFKWKNPNVNRSIKTCIYLYTTGSRSNCFESMKNKYLSDCLFVCSNGQCEWLWDHFSQEWSQRQLESLNLFWRFRLCYMNYLPGMLSIARTSQNRST